MSRFYVVLLLILLSSNNINAQWISGKVICSDDGNQAIGASVEIKGTLRGTITDIEGNYRIEVDSTHTTLLFAFIGYKKQEINIGNDSIINVTLVNDDISLEELLVFATVSPKKVMFSAIDTIVTIKKVGIFKTKKITRRIYPIQNERQCQLLGVKKHWAAYEFLKKMDMFKYIFDNLNYSELSACSGVQGKVIVRLKIDWKGEKYDVELLKSLEESIDNEVLSVIRAAPNLTDNERGSLTYPRFRTPVYYVLPIIFRIYEEKVN
jgi:hypothetical protein